MRTSGRVHPYPRKDRLYTVRDPDDNQVYFLIIATEWSSREWSLDIVYKTEDNNIVDFYTFCPNHSNWWTSLETESPDPNHRGKILIGEEIEHRRYEPISRELIWNYLMEQ